MKSNLSKAAITLSMLLVALLGSCGKGQQDKEGNLDALVDAMIEQVNRLPDALQSIKDKESAQQAAKVIREVGDELDGIAKRMDQLDVPSAEEKKPIGQKIHEATKAGDEKIRAMDLSSMADPEIQKITEDAMTAFREKMKKPEEIFTKFGKGSE